MMRRQIWRFHDRQKKGRATNLSCSNAGVLAASAEIKPQQYNILGLGMPHANGALAPDSIKSLLLALWFGRLNVTAVTPYS